eukprot:2402065-Amphidinium_carterae.1
MGLLTGSVFCADLNSLRFLRTHGFDFNAYFESAHWHTRLPPVDSWEYESLTAYPLAYFSSFCSTCLNH